MEQRAPARPGWARISARLLAAYAILMAFSILAPRLGLDLHLWIAPALTVLAFSFALLHAAGALGRRRAALLLALSLLVSLGLESVGVASGRIYGPYHYTQMLGPKFLGLVPYTILAAWFMMLYPALVTAQALLGLDAPRTAGARLALAILGAVVMTAWDLVMDPLMARLGFWVWEVEGAYFGIPLQNYAGWLLTSGLVLAGYLWLAPALGPSPAPPPPAVERQAVWAYAVTWAGNSGAAWLLGLQGPVLVGLFSGGVLAALALWRLGWGAKWTDRAARGVA